MSLDTVAEDIRDDARAQAEEILEEAEDEASTIIEEAEAEADSIRASAEEAVEAEIEQARDQRLSSAKLEAKQERLAARRDALAEVRELVEDRLRTLEADRREELTRTLLEAALEEFDEDATVEIKGNAEDGDLLATIAEDYDRVSVAGNVDCLGGVVAEASGSRVRVDNTFDSVLESVWEGNLQAISNRLFPEE